MKSIKKSHIFLTLLFASMLVGLHVKGVYGSNEVGKPDGNGGVSQIGVVRLSTAPENAKETRAITVTNTGILKTFQGVSKSSFCNVASSTNTDPTDGITSSTFTVANSTSLLPNPNVFAVAYSSEPVFYKGFVIGNATTMRVQVWDSRGATETVKGAIPLFDGVVSSGSTVGQNFNHWISSGLTVRHGPSVGGFTATHQWEVTKQE